MEQFNNLATKRYIFRYFSEKTPIPAGYFFITTIILGILLLYNGIGVLFIEIILGFLYPGYMTFKGLKYGNKEISMRYAKYWVVLCIGVAIYIMLIWFIPHFPLFKFFTAISIIFLVKSDALLAVSFYDEYLSDIIKGAFIIFLYLLLSMERVINKLKTD